MQRFYWKHSTSLFLGPTVSHTIPVSADGFHTLLKCTLNSVLKIQTGNSITSKLSFPRFGYYCLSLCVKYALLFTCLYVHTWVWQPVRETLYQGTSAGWQETPISASRAVTLSWVIVILHTWKISEKIHSKSIWSARFRGGMIKVAFCLNYIHIFAFFKILSIAYFWIFLIF